MKRYLQKTFPDLWTLKKNQLDIEKFTACLEEAWGAVPQAFVDGLIDSLPRRLAAVKKARGWYTRY